jgi:hypothetical protein
VKREMEQLLRAAENSGWRIERGGHGHKAFSPDGITVVSIHSTPRDYRTFKNIRAKLRRGGLDC